MKASLKTLADAQSAGRTALSEAEGKAVLADYGIAVPTSGVARDKMAAAKLCAGMTPPFVVKVISPDILHKSDAGGVALNLPDAKAVCDAIDGMTVKPTIAGASIEGWLIEQMAPAGREFVVGGFRDPQFGPMIMVGLGGIFVEVMQDVAFRICPITEGEAHEMLDGLRGAPLLRGVRGEAGIDRTALIDVMLKVGGDNGLLVSHSGLIGELDLNPVIVSERGAVAADARFILATNGVDATDCNPPPGSTLPALDRFRPLFEPQSVAVLGASTKDTTMANTFIRRMKDFGYQGAIYPIHPKAGAVEGLPAFSSLASTPLPVDYAYIAIGSERIPDVLGAVNGRCRFAQVISSGFGEVEHGKELEAELVQKAHRAGVRVLGPNCLGTYSPRGGLTFPAGAPKEVGQVGIISQSGGLSTDIIKRGQWRGLRYSGLVTIGNSADVKPVELLEYYLEDPQTKAIGLYLEDIKDGRAFFDLLRSEYATKPVVILKGGRSSQGRLAAASHTGALAGDDRGWDALELQTPVVLVSSVDAFINALLALQCFELRPDRPTRAITLFGNGGGSGVLGADDFARVGLDVSPFCNEARERLEALGLPPGTSVANPVDTPVRTLQEKDGWVAGEILDIIYETASPEAIAMHLNLASFVGRGGVDPIDNLLKVVEEIQARRPGQAHFGLALRSDGSAELDESKRHYRERARLVNVPVFDEIPEMAAAFSAVARLEHQLGRA